MPARVARTTYAMIATSPESLTSKVRRTWYVCSRKGRQLKFSTVVKDKNERTSGLHRQPAGGEPLNVTSFWPLKATAFEHKCTTFSGGGGTSIGATDHSDACSTSSWWKEENVLEVSSTERNTFKACAHVTITSTRFGCLHWSRWFAWGGQAAVRRKHGVCYVTYDVTANKSREFAQKDMTQRGGEQQRSSNALVTCITHRCVTSLRSTISILDDLGADLGAERGGNSRATRGLLLLGLFFLGFVFGDGVTSSVVLGVGSVSTVLGSGSEVLGSWWIDALTKDFVERWSRLRCRELCRKNRADATFAK